VPADLTLVRRLSRADHGLAIVALTRPDGTMHASLVNAGVLDDPVTGAPRIGFVSRGDAKKLVHVRRAGRVSVVFRSGWEWVAVEGPAQVVGPDDPAEGIGPGQLPQLLRDIFSAAGGTHEDWDEYDRVMAAERRAAVLVEPARISTN
jgi:PPOX class probable F420-dependent enzyme